MFDLINTWKDEIINFLMRFGCLFYFYSKILLTTWTTQIISNNCYSTSLRCHNKFYFKRQFVRPSQGKRWTLDPLRERRSTNFKIPRKRETSLLADSSLNIGLELSRLNKEVQTILESRKWNATHNSLSALYFVTDQNITKLWDTFC
jgi:hypothetical protein